MSDVIEKIKAEILRAPIPNEDRTGLCTVREVAAMILESDPHPIEQYRNMMEMCFFHEGKWLNVEIRVTRVSDTYLSEDTPTDFMAETRKMLR